MTTNTTFTQSKRGTTFSHTMTKMPNTLIIVQLHNVGYDMLMLTLRSADKAANCSCAFCLLQLVIIGLEKPISMPLSSNCKWLEMTLMLPLRTFCCICISMARIRVSVEIEICIAHLILAK